MRELTWLKLFSLKFILTYNDNIIISTDTYLKGLTKILYQDSTNSTTQVSLMVSLILVLLSFNWIEITENKKNSIVHSSGQAIKPYPVPSHFQIYQTMIIVICNVISSGKRKISEGLGKQ